MNAEERSKGSPFECSTTDDVEMEVVHTLQPLLAIVDQNAITTLQTFLLGDLCSSKHEVT